MGEMAEYGKMMNDSKKERHNQWFIHNMESIKDMEFTFKDTVCLFREQNKPKVDFYPHTGRWKSQGKMYSGGGKKFMEWYERGKK